MKEAALTLERLAQRVAVGSVPFGGFYVLARDPEFAAARADPAFAATLDQLWPAYVTRWPSGSARAVPRQP
jgi:hypothetical protein